jgi:hypothetical protein
MPAFCAIEQGVMVQNGFQNSFVIIWALQISLMSVSFDGCDQFVVAEEPAALLDALLRIAPEHSLNAFLERFAVLICPLGAE